MQIDVNSGPPYDNGLSNLNLNAAASAGGIYGGQGSTGAALVNAANHLEHTMSAASGSGGLISSGHASNSS